MGDSDSDDDNIIRYGTPLEPYEEDEIPSKRKYQQAPDQYAVDAHGRRRFHGAFTGGFSAGFGNTVGTAEGWTPAAFKSSRSEKASVSVNQRPEDFMDEEDRGEFGIAPRQMQTQMEFSGQKRKLQQRYHDGPIPGEPVLEGLLRPVHETAAMRMLRAMGWKEGQGIGDRVSKKDKATTKDQHKVYGCYLPPDLKQGTANQESSDSECEYDYETLFAPDDYEPYILQRKNDRFGLGYSGLSRRSILGSLTSEYGSDAGPSKSHLYMKDKGKKVSIRGQAFGVGAFEAEDDDIYATEDMSHYDFTLGGATGNKADKKAVKHTESNVLEGFTKSSQPLPSVPAYPPPALPRDYVPIPAHTKRTRFEPTHHQPRDQGLGRHELLAQARGEILGEEPVPKVTIPIENPTIIDPKPTVRNVNFVSSDSLTEVATAPDYISIKDSGRDLTNVFKPFSSDPKKQARYESYLVDKGRVEENAAKETDRLSAWERNREMVEFEQAAKLYKPLTGVMFDRFTHASQPDEALNPLCSVAKSSNSYGLASQEMVDAAKQGCYGVMTRKETIWRPETLVCKRFNIPDPYVARPESAKEDKPKVSYSIFSYLESSIHDKDSFAKEQTKFSGSKSLDVGKTLINKPNDQVNKLVEENVPKNDTVNINNDTVNQTAPGFSKRMTVAELFLKESEKDLKSKEKGEEITDTIDKFNKMELYKAIFLSDTEDEEETGENEELRNKEFNVNDLLDIPKNVERNTSPPRGIFANIDFDELNSWRRKVEVTTNNKETPKDNTKPQNIVKETNKEPNKEDNEFPTTIEAENETYGPKIPDNLLKRLAAPETQVNLLDDFKPKFKSRTDRQKEGKPITDKEKVVEVDSSSSDSWVDAEQVKKKKDKKKKSKKHKTKHNKSKHKKKNK